MPSSGPASTAAAPSRCTRTSSAGCHRFYERLGYRVVKTQLLFAMTWIEITNKEATMLRDKQTQERATYLTLTACFSPHSPSFPRGTAGKATSPA